MLHTKYQGSKPCGFRQEDFLMFCLINIGQCKTHDPWVGLFGPRDIISTNLVEVYLVMLHMKYQGSRTYGFRQEDFFHVYPYISLCKTCEHGAGHFWPKGHNLKTLGRGPHGDATN